MSCKLEAELTAYVDGELAAPQASAVRAHLLLCADCRTTELLLRQTVHRLAALPSFEPSIGLRRTVLQKVDAAPAPWGQRLRRWLRPAVLVPAGLVTAGAMALLAAQALRPSLPPDLKDGAGLDVAMNFDVVANYDILGLDEPDDVEVVAHLQELEGRP
jgi:anti-sigma factor RsiW